MEAALCYLDFLVMFGDIADEFVNIVIILFGLMCAILGVYYSSHALVRAFHGHEPRPFQGH